jgi:hypothetical protein
LSVGHNKVEAALSVCNFSWMSKMNLLSANPVDSTRMDLVIPGEQHIYLRAATCQERQQWIVALGSAKACVTTRNRKDSGAAA